MHHAGWCYGRKLSWPPINVKNNKIIKKYENIKQLKLKMSWIL